MSKAVRKQLLQKIELLEKGTKKSEELIVETRINDCIGMLMDCQDLAIAIGTYIEKLYGIGTRMVSVLEDYCEKLYAVAEQVQQEETIGDCVAALDVSMHGIRVAFEQEFQD